MSKELLSQYLQDYSLPLFDEYCTLQCHYVCSSMGNLSQEKVKLVLIFAAFVFNLHFVLPTHDLSGDLLLMF